jgi:exopolysaccharide biosynthesis polyprenyl glycosylphosphotransferase
MRRFLRGKKNLFFILLYMSDVAGYIFSAFIGAAIFLPQEPFYTRFFLFIMLILLINYSAYRLYKDKRSLFNDNDFMGLLYSGLITFFVAAVFVFMFELDIVLISATALTLGLTLILTSVARYILYKVIYIFRKMGYDRKRVLFFGTNNQELLQKLKENKSLGYRVVKTTGKINVLKKWLGKVDIVFLTREQLDDRIMELVMENDHINWKIVPGVLNLVIEPVAFDEFRDYPIINVSERKIPALYLAVKRLMDISLSAISLIILAIPFAVIALLIKITMPGPVFFRQERLGKDLEPFTVYKFRTMVVDADRQKSKLRNEVKGLFKIKDDPRVTRFGKFLRRSCLDELPQLINVLKGDMSIVGPRPHLKIELENFKGWRMQRFRVKPGITGMWQVSGRHEINFDKAVMYDIYYIKNMGLVTDISIILKTIPAILMTRGRY